MKPKYKDINWDVMWEVFPEATAFACDEDGALRQFKGKCVKPYKHIGKWCFASAGAHPIGFDHYIATYDLEDVDWKDTLKVRPKKSNLKEFEDRLLEESMQLMTSTYIDPLTAAEITSKAVRIAKEVFKEEK